MTISNLERCFSGKKILITGHTGFKGSWLSIWLHSLGAEVVGISDQVPTMPSHFEAASISNIVKDHRCNLDDRESICKIVAETQPDFVFHLAAQALVKRSYQDPIETLRTNIMGSAHVLEALRQLEKKCVAIMITSDKCYDNNEWEWGYRETDRLGGKDPYSASKGAAELVIKTFVESFLSKSAIRTGIARAGNVIGGGDWAADRLVPDCIRAWSMGESVSVHNPAATRPWQLVLEPLAGYLAFAMYLDRSDELSGEAFNFGPLAENDYSVKELIVEMQRHWENVKWSDQSEVQPGDGQERVYEAGLLKLNCDKALHHLAWKPTYNFQNTVEATMNWYRQFYQADTDILSLSRKQIDDFCRDCKIESSGVGAVVADDLCHHRQL